MREKILTDHHTKITNDLNQLEEEFGKEAWKIMVHYGRPF